MKRVIEIYNQACNELADAVNRHLFEGSRDWYWVADDAGGLADFGDTDFLKPDEMALILEHEVTYDQYIEWREDNIKYRNKGLINLKSWLKGCRHYMLKEPTN